MGSQRHRHGHRRLSPWRVGSCAVLLVAGSIAVAQPATGPADAVAAPKPSIATDATAYRRDAARHLYARYAAQIWHGKLPPLLHAVLITDTEVDAGGHVLGVTVVRAPAEAGEVTPRVIEMIRKASPFPPPAAIGRPTVYREIWLIDRSGRFQVDTLSEGQL